MRPSEFFIPGSLIRIDVDSDNPLAYAHGGARYLTDPSRQSGHHARANTRGSARLLRTAIDDANRLALTSLDLTGRDDTDPNVDAEGLDDALVRFLLEPAERVPSL